jgi:hypothetical protein
MVKLMSPLTDTDLLALMRPKDGHLTIELHWLLSAAIEFTNRYDEGGALRVILQDSALLHGRTLLDFARLPANSEYFRLANFVKPSAAPCNAGIPWHKWLDFINSQTSHLGTRRNTMVEWPYGMSHESPDRMKRLADDVLRVFEANSANVRGGQVHDRYDKLVAWGRDHLDRLDPPTPLQPLM